MINGHGDDIFRYGDKVKVNFSTNICQDIDHTSLMRHLMLFPGLLSNYPEPEPLSVERLLAAEHGINEENILVTNGATEAIYLIARKMQGKRSTVIVPTFREYQDACAMYGHNINFLTEENFIGIGIIEDDNDAVWLCNPNNPTGRIYDRSLLLRLADSMPHTLFIIDQAYADYSVADLLTVDDVMLRRNIVLLYSLTKRFSVPGLRIGYAVAPLEVTLALRSMRMPWGINSFATEASHYLLAHKSDYKIDSYLLNQEVRRIGEALKVFGISSGPTDCNFLLCELPYGSSASLKEWLVNNRGLLIRDASNFESLGKCHFRIAAQSPERNDLLIRSIEEWIML
ncbi:MAG: aminotransferase class I/II-fold pyridoxal phosphate-dependent enzyme [Muribaculaceae bacterium]|nr:aminotransferase class I/II-fold pyridoxal phosphate-dependent enzyme [Muribaculaceae bacterium]